MASVDMRAGDRRTQRRIRNAMAKIRSGTRLVKEGQVELAAIIRAITERAQLAQEPCNSQKSSPETVGHANCAEGRQ